MAETEAQEAVNSVEDARTKGYLKQQLAEYRHRSDPSAAQELQLAAVQLNRRLVRPLSGIRYSKLAAPTRGQPVEAVSYMGRFLEKNELIIWINGLLESLAWGEDQTGRFETALYDLGKILGFGSQRPESDNGRGPDNLWALGDGKYLVIECKSGVADGNLVNKHDCNQLNGSMAWFEQEYDSSCTARPVMIHRNTKSEHAATFPANTRIIEEPSLAKLKSAVRKYAQALGDSYTDVNVVAKQFAFFKLDVNSLLQTFSVAPRA